METFITNSGDNNLRKNIDYLLSKSSNMDFLVGFVYFNGLTKILKSMNEHESLKLRLLVGLKTDKITGGALIELNNEKNDRESIKADLSTSINNQFNDIKYDTEEVKNNVELFKNLIDKGQIEIRKTLDPNHGKLYLFKKYDLMETPVLITGSSNLTKKGFEGQDEFNVVLENKEFYTKGKEYFDELWGKAVEISQEFIEVITKAEKDFILTPYEAYVLAMKYYLEDYVEGEIDSKLAELMQNAGLQVFNYQTDAVASAIRKIDKYNGVILADVVGLGKSVITSMLCKTLNAKCLIICPPGLKESWNDYRKKFELNCIDVYSLGVLDNIKKNVMEYRPDIIVIDEAHRFRNSSSSTYEQLYTICHTPGYKGQMPKVVLLTATPFNNSTDDILSLLRLFMDTDNCPVEESGNLTAMFHTIQGNLNILFDIERDKDGKGLEIYNSYFNLKTKASAVDYKRVKAEQERLSGLIKDKIKNFVIRRNRLDLKRDRYKEVLKNVSKVNDPIPCWYKLDANQDKYYDEIIGKYFNPDSKDKDSFSATIYRPEFYANLSDDQSEQNLVTQKNLTYFIKRLLIKRFESSFGAFRDSLENIKNNHKNVLDYLGYEIEELDKYKDAKSAGTNYISNQKTKNTYILDSGYIADYLDDEKPIIPVEEFLEKHTKNKSKRKRTMYNVDAFPKKTSFIYNIYKDYKLLERLVTDLDTLGFCDSDPKFAQLLEEMDQKRTGKLIIFTEYKDTVKHLENQLKNCGKTYRYITVSGSVEGQYNTIRKEFDASVKPEEQTDDIDILIGTDVISEGFNLNRADTIINYDIPWNPVRVIQRLGRINRIGKKVYDNLYIKNFFPTKKGEDDINIKATACKKMSLIHNALGEDAKIFDAAENPHASGMGVSKIDQIDIINANPEDLEQMTFDNQVMTDYDQVPQDVKDRVSKINNRLLKTAKAYNKNQFMSFLYTTTLIPVIKNEKGEISPVAFKDIYEDIKCDINDKNVFNNKTFNWKEHAEITEYFNSSKRELKQKNTTANSLYSQALNNLNFMLRAGESVFATYREKIAKIKETLSNTNRILSRDYKVIKNIKNENDLNIIDELYLKYCENYDETKKEIKKDFILFYQNVKEK